MLVINRWKGSSPAISAWTANVKLAQTRWIRSLYSCDPRLSLVEQVTADARDNLNGPDEDSNYFEPIFSFFTIFAVHTR
jgi:hypothetical protein